MITASRAAIGYCTLAVTAATMVFCSSGVVVSADASKNVTNLAKGPTDKTVRTIDTAEQLTPTVLSTSQRGVVQGVHASLSSEKLRPNRLTKIEWSALQGFYGEEDRKPLWVNQKGLTKNARDVVAEFRSADDYGLRPSDYELPNYDSVAPTSKSLAKVELRLSMTALIYARHAKGGRVPPNKAGLQLTYTPATIDPLQFLKTLSSAVEPSAYLHSLHPQHSQFVQLRKKLLEMRNNVTAKVSPKIPNGPVLKRGMSHAHVVLLRNRLGINSRSGNPSTDDTEVFDGALEKAIQTFQRANGLAVDGVVGAGTRRALNGRSPDRLITQILINMERWRWLPDDLGSKTNMYVWANVPDLRVRVFQGNASVFSEKGIFGQVSHKTPVFSDHIKWIELHPTWFVPVSIKVNDILPSLRRPTSTVMERYNLRVNCGKYGTDHKTINWRSIDIRQCSFTQPPGKASVLGDFKFKFPNKHSVYLHDTHKPGLFNRTNRTLSHGCIRVQRPRRLAEILLEHDHGMTPERIGKILKGPKTLHKATLKQPIPIHITYFTILFDEQGALKNLPDYYNHDGRLARILIGKSYNVVKVNATKRKARGKKETSKKQANWWDGLLLSN